MPLVGRKKGNVIGRLAAATTKNNVREEATVTVDTIQHMLLKMINYFATMVDKTSDRFYYRCLPQSCKLIHQHCPIRDLGSAWDTTNALLFFKRQQEKVGGNKKKELLDSTTQHQLEKAVMNTIRVYSSTLIPAVISSGGSNTDNRTEGLMLSSKILQEPANIAHSAFLLLATSGAIQLSLFQNNNNNNNNIPPIDEIVRGILAMQRNNGAFQITYGSSDIMRGIEFYPGEAILALMEIYKLSDKHIDIIQSTTKEAIINAIEKAFTFYSNYYYSGNVDPRYASFFGNWQVQAFVGLWDIWRQEQQNIHKAESISNYIIELCQNIVKSETWQELNNGPTSYMKLSTVEIACGLEALAEGVHVAKVVSRKVEETVLWNNCLSAIKFLKTVQDQIPSNNIGNGGLGHSIHLSEQRLDVTGHAMNALIKVHDTYSGESCAEI